MPQAVTVEPIDQDISTDGETFILGSDVGNVNSAFFRMLSAGSRATGSGRTGFTSNVGADGGCCALQLTGTSQLTGHKETGTHKALGEVWTYRGPPGGDHEFIVRWRGMVSMANQFSVSVPIAGIVNEDKCVPVQNGVYSPLADRNDDWNRVTVALAMDGAGNLVVSRNNSSAGQVDVYIEVVEFTGSAWSVGHAVSALHDAADVTLNMNTDSDGASGTAFDVGDWATALIIGAYMEGDSAEDGISDTLGCAKPGALTTQVDWAIHQDGNARCDGAAHLHIIQNAGLAVYRAENNNWGEGNGAFTSISWPGGTPTDRALDQLAWEFFADTSGTGTAHARGAVGPNILSAAGTAQGWVHRSGNTVRLWYGIVDLTALTYTEGGGPPSPYWYFARIAGVVGGGQYYVRDHLARLVSIRLADSALPVLVPGDGTTAWEYTHHCTPSNGELLTLNDTHEVSGGFFFGLYPGQDGRFMFTPAVLETGLTIGFFNGQVLDGSRRDAVMDFGATEVQCDTDGYQLRYTHPSSAIGLECAIERIGTTINFIIDGVIVHSHTGHNQDYLFAGVTGRHGAQATGLSLELLEDVTPVAIFPRVVDSIATGATTLSVGLPAGFNPRIGEIVFCIVGDDNHNAVSAHPWTETTDDTRVWQRFFQAGETASNVSIAGFWCTWASGGTPPAFENTANMEKWCIAATMSQCNPLAPIAAVTDILEIESGATSHPFPAIFAGALDSLHSFLGFDGADVTLTQAPGHALLSEVKSFTPGSEGGGAAGLLTQNNDQSGVGGSNTSTSSDGSASGQLAMARHGSAYIEITELLSGEWEGNPSTTPSLDATTIDFTAPDNCLLMVVLMCVHGGASIQDDIDLITTGLTWTRQESVGVTDAYSLVTDIHTAPVTTGSLMNIRALNTVGSDATSGSRLLFKVFAVTHPDGVSVGVVDGNVISSNDAHSLPLSAAPSPTSLMISARGLVPDDGSDAPATAGRKWKQQGQQYHTDTGFGSLQIQTRIGSHEQEADWDDVNTGPGNLYSGAAVAIEIKAAP